ncbi:LLM class F420-dependent oxidoreductase [uncultured Mycolicibacterium sp.]|uniref:LLM class F420-dependent oxidoreductase n=1 Tax=uncultured Mycolicibacterium sp. TaxID=2320817 RepID=UPI002601929E|nr:LLM class F420-dependent oxidoreductase [uncultured Mycolicibacterium sp.]
MRVGLSTPVVMQLPGVASDWEATGTPADLAEIARAADTAGVEFLTCSEHVAVPSAEAGRRGAVYWDPLATLGFLAAVTTRIRLVTAVVVLPYHHPLELAKRYGTLDRLSGGRVVLGVGIGTLRAEFELLGAPFERRGARADEAIRALRASLGRPEPEFAGEFYRFGGMTVEPHAVQQRMPIWVGGRSEASLRRAVGLADGWMPFGLSGRAIAELLAGYSLPERFEVVLPTGRAVDPLGDPDGTRDRIAALARAGATVAQCTVAARSAEHYCEQVVALVEIADTVKGRG